MTTDNIIALSRILTHTDSEQVTDANALLFLNIVYHKIANTIIEQIDEDYFWDIFTVNPGSVATQNEYTFAVATATTPGMKKIQRIQIKWTATDSFQTLVPSDTLASYNDSTDRINANYSTSQGFFDIKDGSYFIYPAPKESVTGGIEVQATSTLIDLVSGGAETTIYPRNSDLRDYHELLAIGMKQYIYSQQGLTSEKNDSINEFDKSLNEMLETIKDRYSNPIEAVLPSAYYLKT